MSAIQECLSFEVNGWTVEILELFIILRVSVVEGRLLSVCVGGGGRGGTLRLGV